MIKDLITDKVTLVKANGEVAREDIPAHVQSKLIIIPDETVPLEVGDHLLRTLGNGLVEDFIVDDPAYYGKNIAGMDSHFQVKVSRSGSPANAGSVIQSITNNFAGANSRVNIQSTDNSTNIVEQISSEKIKDFIQEVRPVLDRLPDAAREIVDAELVVLGDEANKAQPSQLKARGALQSIRTAAEGATGNLVASGIIALIASMV